MGLLIIYTTVCGFLLNTGVALQIQCYQCEEFEKHDCSSPENIVNCTVNVQDMCQKEVVMRSDGALYRKSCATSAACLIASSGYQSFCAPGKVGSVCISCCNTPFATDPGRGGGGAQLQRPQPDCMSLTPCCPSCL